MCRMLYRASEAQRCATRAPIRSQTSLEAMLLCVADAVLVEEVYRHSMHVRQLNSNKQSAGVCAHPDSGDDSLALKHCAGLCTATK